MFSAIALSILFIFKALLSEPWLRFILRVCTSAECRYRLCGITVAPMMPIAMYKAAWPGMCGIKPLATMPSIGLASTISVRKHPPIIAISAIMNASSFRMPSFCRYRSNIVSSNVTTTPHINGKPNSKLSPMAMPSTSARSHAAIAISASRYNTRLIAGGYTSRLHWARSRPLTMPSLALNDCKSSAIRLLINNTHINP